MEKHGVVFVVETFSRVSFESTDDHKRTISKNLKIDVLSAHFKRLLST